jgi:hypothetical protein
MRITLSLLLQVHWRRSAQPRARFLPMVDADFSAAIFCSMAPTDCRTASGLYLVSTTKPRAEANFVSALIALNSRLVSAGFSIAREFYLSVIGNQLV